MVTVVVKEMLTGGGLKNKFSVVRVLRENLSLVAKAFITTIVVVPFPASFSINSFQLLWNSFLLPPGL